MKTWLVDTGPVVAYLDAGDPAHADVAARWDSFRGQLVTTSAVITEAMYFVSTSPSGARHAWWTAGYFGQAELGFRDR